MDLRVKAEVALAAKLLLAKSAISATFTSFFLLHPGVLHIYHHFPWEVVEAMEFHPALLYFFWLIYRLASWTSKLEISPVPVLLLLCPAPLQI